MKRGFSLRSKILTLSTKHKINISVSGSIQIYIVKFISKIGQESTFLDYKKILKDPIITIWSTSQEHNQIRKMIYDAFIDYLVHAKASNGYFTFGKMYSSGAVSINKSFEEYEFEEIEKTFFALAKKLIDSQYIVQLSEIKYFSNGTQSQILYLKPSYQLPKIDNKSNQLLGNVHMELKSEKDQLVDLKIIVHRYNDRKWHAGHDFDVFMNYLFNDANVELY